MASVATGAALYLYAITKAGSGEIQTRGINGAAVEKIAQGDVGAIVSRTSAGPVRPRRTNLAAHHQVLRWLTARDTVLPMTFGTVADSEEDLRTLLARNHDALVALLGRVEGKVEMSLKVYWDTPNVFDYFVVNHRELAGLRDRLFQCGRKPTTDEKIQLGRLFETLLFQSRQRHTQRVVEALQAYCEEIRTTDPGEERMVMKLACLVKREQQKLWEKGVREVARSFDDQYCFACSGPFAPQNFAETELTEEF